MNWALNVYTLSVVYADLHPTEIMSQLYRINLLVRFGALLAYMACSALLTASAYGADTVKIGVLAFRDKEQTVAQWQPLTLALKKSMPEYDFEVEAMTYPELNAAVTNRQLDFVLTNPGHFVLLAKRHGLSAPLASLAVHLMGKKTSEFGGVIFSRAEQTHINTLRDIKGKKIAIVDTDSLGGYQMQAYELSRTDIRLPENAKLTLTGMPHDRVVDAILSGHADVGFVRTGVLEGLEQEGKLNLQQIKIINRQTPPYFPALLSTRLYPEWPFSSLPHTDERLARHVAATLFLLQESDAATASAIGIRGFSVPADYTSVADLLRELRLPPFEDTPRFTLHDVWIRYRQEVLGSFLVIGLILALSGYLLQQKQRLKESESNLRATLDASPDMLFELGLDGRYYAYHSPRPDWPQGLPESRIGKHVLDVLPRETADVLLAAVQEADERGHSFGKQLKLDLPNGEAWFELSLARKAPLPNQEPHFIVLARDITERKQMADQVHQLAFYDPLTNLPNRRLLYDRLSQTMAISKRNGCYCALMFLDLDNFKPLNDTHGHEMGDLLLIEVANRLRGCVREMDTVARIGGDEFVVIIGELAKDKEVSATLANHVAEKIRVTLAEPYVLTVMHNGEEKTVEHRSSVSVGITLFIAHEVNQCDLFKRADIAMYQAKEGGRNTIAFYDPLPPMLEQ